MQPGESPGELPLGGSASAELAELCALFSQLEPMAGRVALAIMRRLHAGRVYGDFEARRNYVLETSEEIFDAMAYWAVFLMGLAEPRPSGGAVGGSEET